MAVVLLYILPGCNLLPLKENKTAVLARVERDYLFQSDLAGIVPAGLPYADSAALVKRYVNNWVKNKLMLAQAERNLTESQMDFEKQLDDYRSSLVIFRYESLLIDQELDTVVSDDEIRQYYQSHLYDFELKENILRAYFVVLDQENILTERLQEIFILPDSTAIDSLIAFERAGEFFDFSIDTSNWMSFVQFQQLIPVESYNQELFLQNNRIIQIEESGSSYLAKILDFKIKDDITPVEMERDNIRQIIINKRKTKLIKKVRDDIYNKALYNGDFEVY